MPQGSIKIEMLEWNGIHVYVVHASHHNAMFLLYNLGTLALLNIHTFKIFKILFRNRTTKSYIYHLHQMHCSYIYNYM